MLLSSDSRLALSWLDPTAVAKSLGRLAIAESRCWRLCPVPVAHELQPQQLNGPPAVPVGHREQLDPDTTDRLINELLQHFQGFPVLVALKLPTVVDRGAADHGLP